MVYGNTRLFFSNFKLSGIKSIIEVHIMTPEAKASAEAIILFWFFLLIKTVRYPIKVDNPERKVNKKEYFILFIISQ